MIDKSQPTLFQVFLIVFTSILFSTITCNALAADSFSQFIEAYVESDLVKAYEIVSKNTEEMQIVAIQLVNETATLTDKQVLPPEEEQRVKTVLSLTAYLIEVLGIVHTGENSMYLLVESNRKLLSPRSFKHITSDVTLSSYLRSLAEKTWTEQERFLVSRDLQSISSVMMLSLQERKLEEITKKILAEEKERQLQIFTRRITSYLKNGNREQLEREATRQDLPVDMRLIAIRALGDHGSETSTSLLIETSKTNELQDEAIKALCKIGGTQAVTYLLTFLGDIRYDQHIRDFMTTMDREVVIPILERHLLDCDNYGGTLDFLISLWGPETNVKITHLLRNTKVQDTGFTIALTQSIIEKGPPDGSQVLESLLQHSDRDVRRAAIAQLVQVSGSKAVPTLIDLLEDPWLTGAASMGLKEIGRDSCTYLVSKLKAPKLTAGAIMAAETIEGLDECDLGLRLESRKELLLGKWWKAAIQGPISTIEAWDLTKDTENLVGKGPIFVLSAYLGSGFLLLAMTLITFFQTWSVQPTPLLAQVDQTGKHSLNLSWLKSKYSLKLKKGQRQRKPGFFKTISSDIDIEPGTILRTEWAYDRKGKRHAIKLETYVSNNSFTQSFQINKGASPHQLYNDLLITVGRSVKPGKYLADCDEGTVKITIT
jgi:HEAT repeat protein